MSNDRVGNDGLTDQERAVMADEYAATGGKKPSAEARARIAEALSGWRALPEEEKRRIRRARAKGQARRIADEADDMDWWI